MLALGLGACRKKTEEKPVAVEPLTVLAERIASSRARTPEEVRPYDESLAWHEYKVQKVLNGVLPDKIIRVAHWTVLRGRAVPVSAQPGEVVTLKILPVESTPAIRELNHSDDLDITGTAPPRFVDLSQPLPPKLKEQADRSDYNGFFSLAMHIYWKLRPQLRLVVMGNSHATKGICTPMFFERENAATPVALNLAPPGSNMEMQSFMLREYALPLPKIEWIVWVASPRCFNARREDARKFAEFQASPGRAYDVAHQKELWPVSAAPVVKLEALYSLDISNPWGWEGRKATLLPEDMAEAKQQLLKENMPPDFAFSEKRWKLFGETLRALNDKKIRVLVVTLPVHLLFKEMAVADPDGTTHEGATELIARLKTLHVEHPLAWYRDFSNVAEQQLAPDDFYDADHLNRDGSKKITAKIVEWMDEIAKAGQN